MVVITFSPTEPTPERTLRGEGLDFICDPSAEHHRERYSSYSSQTRNIVILFVGSMCVHVYDVCTGPCVHVVCMEGRGQHGLETASGLELSDMNRWTPGINLSLPPQCWGYRLRHNARPLNRGFWRWRTDPPVYKARPYLLEVVSHPNRLTLQPAVFPDVSHHTRTFVSSFVICVCSTRVYTCVNKHSERRSWSLVFFFLDYIHLCLLF